jgi:hypothetical protein
MYLLNVHTVSDVMQMRIHAVEPLILDTSSFEVEIEITKLKKYKSPGIDQIPSELIQAGGETLSFETQKLNNSAWNME